jgi:hypothetical protein
MLVEHSGKFIAIRGLKYSANLTPTCLIPNCRSGQFLEKLPNKKCSGKYGFSLQSVIKRKAFALYFYIHKPKHTYKRMLDSVTRWVCEIIAQNKAQTIVVNNNAYAIYTSEKSIPNVLEKLDINYKNHPKEAIAQYVGESSPNMETLLFLKNHFWLFWNYSVYIQIAW